MGGDTVTSSRPAAPCALKCADGARGQEQRQHQAEAASAVTKECEHAQEQVEPRGHVGVELAAGLHTDGIEHAVEWLTRGGTSRP